MACQTVPASQQLAATLAMVSSAAPVRPISLPNRPAMNAATSGSNGMASSVCRFMLSAAQLVQFFDVDAAPLAEQHHQDCQANGRFSGGYREDEEYEHLPVDLPEVARERHKVEIGGQQQQFDAHQQQ